MTELHDLNKNTPAPPPDERGTASSDPEETHRRVEREANKAAERGNVRQDDDDQREFSNVGPI